MIFDRGECRLDPDRYGSRGGAPVLVLVKAANSMNHRDYEIDHPPWAAWCGRVAERRRLVRYDQRGNGLSDASLAGVSFETFVADLASRVDAGRRERLASMLMPDASTPWSERPPTWPRGCRPPRRRAQCWSRRAPGACSAGASRPRISASGGSRASIVRCDCGGSPQSGPPHAALRLQCSPHHAGSGLYPVVRQLRHAAGIGEADPPARPRGGGRVRRGGDAAQEARLRLEHLRGNLLFPSGDAEACVALARKHRLEGVLAANLSMLGLARMYCLELEGARRDMLEAIAIAEQGAYLRAENNARICLHERALDRAQRASIDRDPGARLTPRSAAPR